MKPVILLLPFGSEEINGLINGNETVTRKRYPDFIKESNFDDDGIAEFSETVKSYIYCKSGGKKLSVNGIKGNGKIVGVGEFAKVRKIKNENRFLYEWEIKSVILFDIPKPFENAFEGVCRFLINGCCTDKRKLVCKEIEGGCEGCFVPLDGVPKDYAYIGGIIDEYLISKTE